MKIKAVNENEVLIEFSNTIDLEVRKEITAYQNVLKDLQGVNNFSCGYNQIMVNYDYEILDLEAALKDIIFNHIEKEKNIIRIPVCYEAPFGLDTKEVCEIHQIDEETLIEKHTSTLYPVFMMGFIPGFPYLGHLDPELETPRRKNPRIKIPKGSVGIGGKQTGIYPCASPGGWQIIGQTPLELLDLENNDTLIHRGDYIKFYAIDKATFDRIKEAGNYDRT